MGVRDGTTSFVEVAGGMLDQGEQTSTGREKDDPAADRSVKVRADWGPILAFAAMMAVPFALVAWLMS